MEGHLADEYSVLETFSNEAQIVRQYLEVSMKPDPGEAARHVAKDVHITFTGGKVFDHPADSASVNEHRYLWVKK